jgi:5,6-dimethylbenzimidazole synthase
MDLFEAIKGRRSCRNFLSDPVKEDDLYKILEAGSWAPSPLNGQPWEFIVITGKEVKEKIFLKPIGAGNGRSKRAGGNGWPAIRWISLKGVPAFVGVIGDPEKGGVDRFQEEGGVAYQHACAAAIQNMQLAAYALGYAALWFTLFDRKALREILAIPKERVPVALLCLGKASAEIPQTPRKDFKEMTRFLP